MITVRRIMGVETEYALIDRDDPRPLHARAIRPST